MVHDHGWPRPSQQKILLRRLPYAGLSQAQGKAKAVRVGREAELLRSNKAQPGAFLSNGQRLQLFLGVHETQSASTLQVGVNDSGRERAMKTGSDMAAKVQRFGVLCLDLVRRL